MMESLNVVKLRWEVGTEVLIWNNIYGVKGDRWKGMHALIILHVSGENKGIEGKGSG